MKGAYIPHKTEYCRPGLKRVLYCIYSLSIHPTDIEIVISIECEKHSSKLNN